MVLANPVHLIRHREEVCVCGWLGVFQVYRRYRNLGIVIPRTVCWSKVPQ